jgi:uncharacterized protein
MAIFLLTFLFLYSGIHLYAFIKFDSIFHFPAGIKILIIIVLIILIFAPLLVRIAESRHLEELARVIAYAGYIWMAFIFSFFCLGIVFDLLRLLLKVVPQGGDAVSLRNIAFGLTLFLSVVFVIYGFIDAQRIRIKKLEIYTEHQLPNNGKIRIVQISDVHIGLIIKEERLQLVLDRVREAAPDMLICTGDLLDGELNNVLPLAGQFQQVKPKYGKYAIVGNHEYYAGIEKSLEFIRAAGFEVLIDEARLVAGINIIGLDDPTGRKIGIVRNNPDRQKRLPKTKGDGFILLLKHQPFVNNQDVFDLQLSGHTHGGQLIPFRLITHFFFPEDYGFYKIAERKSLYVSRGTGTWGPPVRIFAPPEITVIDLIPLTRGER